MADLLALSARVIDEGDTDERINRVTNELSELADDLAIVESFSHVVAFRTTAGLAIVDTATAQLAEGAIPALRRWSDDPVHTIVYTHGHADHVGGAQKVLAEAAERGRPRPHIVGHENVPTRFDRYRLTRGYNDVINTRQFGARGNAIGFPRDWVHPSTTFRDRLTMKVGDLAIELRHAKGETDDHAWGWVAERKTILAGDFFIWNFPNAGNPQKVQRYPVEWARALREMAALEPELFVPAHGLPIAGKERIAMVLDDVASALEDLVSRTLEMMNAGARLDEIVHTVKVPPATLAKPYLRPTYDEPEFVVRNVWRMYGGWYDGNPANLKPATDIAVANEVAALAGGASAMVERAVELAEQGDEDSLRLACHLAEWAGLAAPDDKGVAEKRAQVYEARRRIETSLMARGIFREACASQP